MWKLLHIVEQRKTLCFHFFWESKEVPLVAILCAICLRMKLAHLFMFMAGLTCLRGPGQNLTVSVRCPSSHQVHTSKCRWQLPYILHPQLSKRTMWAIRFPINRNQIWTRGLRQGIHFVLIMGILHFSGTYSQTNLQVMKLPKCNWHTVNPGLLRPLEVRDPTFPGW